MEVVPGSEDELVDEVIATVVGTLGLQDRADAFSADTGLLDSLAELDSMAIVEVIVALEERFDIVVDEDEITGEVFETMGSLATFVGSQLSR